VRDLIKQVLATGVLHAQSLSERLQSSKSCLQVTLGPFSWHVIHVVPTPLAPHTECTPHTGQPDPHSPVTAFTLAPASLIPSPPHPSSLTQLCLVIAAPLSSKRPTPPWQPHPPVLSPHRPPTPSWLRPCRVSTDVRAQTGRQDPSHTGAHRCTQAPTSNHEARPLSRPTPQYEPTPSLLGVPYFRLVPGSTQLHPSDLPLRVRTQPLGQVAKPVPPREGTVEK
jgi:hypothetical protein